MHENGSVVGQGADLAGRESKQPFCPQISQIFTDFGYFRQDPQDLQDGSMNFVSLCLCESKLPLEHWELNIEYWILNLLLSPSSPPLEHWTLNIEY